MTRTLLLAATVAAGLASAASANAAQLTGQFSVMGNVTQNGTTLTFSPNTTTAGLAAITAGTGTQTGSFASLIGNGQSGTITQTVTFTSNGTSTYSGTSTPTLTLGGVTYTVSSLTDVALNSGSGSFDLFTGQGTLTATGYDPTPGTLSFSSQGSGTVTFSATDTANPTAVPEPASMALLGSGLFGLGMIRRRKNRA